MRGYFSRLLVTGVSLLTLGCSGAIIPGIVSAQVHNGISSTTSPSMQRVSLIRQDFSDCVNSNVTKEPALPNKTGGEILVFKSEFDGKLFIETRLDNGTPNTKYNIFLKCHQKIGEISTDNRGIGRIVSALPLNIVPAVFAFDIYPDGAPAGNKFQSLPIRF